MSIALVDCNNFYVSCERVFDPKLVDRPVVVLSGEGGIIVARSNEAKAIGVPMGAPFFEYRSLLRRFDAAILTSNFALYGDLSCRVMQALEFFSPEVQVYSVDEAFLDFTFSNKVEEAKNLRRCLLQWTGIPVSVGLAATKTLAKVASHKAKEEPTADGVFLIDESNVDAILAETPIEEVWGIGRRLAAKLKAKGIFTAAAFRDLEDNWIKKQFSVVSLRTAWELRGRRCFSLDGEPKPQQSITSSRTFGRPVTTFEELSEAFATYAVRAAGKLREQKLAATSLGLFVLFHPYRGGSDSVRLSFPEPTAYTPQLLRYVREGAQKLYREGASYRKAGVHFEGLVPEAFCQPDLFSKESVNNTKRKARAMAAVDSINALGSKKKIKIASEGLKQSWQSSSSLRSPRYTSCWDELLQVNC